MRYALAPLVLALFGCVGSTTAHGELARNASRTPYSDLSRLTLCTEPRSVQVALYSDDAKADEVNRALIKERLHRTLSNTLTSLRVPHETRPSCVGHPGFIYTLFYAHWTYPAAQESYLVYAASLQVGAGTTKLEARPGFFLSESHFEGYDANRLFASDLLSPYQISLPSANEKMMFSLAAAWWDNHAFLQETQYLKQQRELIHLTLLSGALTMLVLLAGWRVTERRKRTATHRRS